MKYTLKCKYSMIDQTFIFVIKSSQKDNNYSYQWMVSNVDKPIYFITNNNILFQSYLENDFVFFKVLKSDAPLNQKQFITKTVPMLQFETDQEQLEIVYDFDHLPNEKQIVVGKIIHEFLQVGGGGFLQSYQEYTYLQQNIMNILENNEAFNNKKNSSETKQENILEQKIEVKEKEVTPQKQSNAIQVKEKSKRKSKKKTDIQKGNI